MFKHFLQPPLMEGSEFVYLKEAFDSGWIAPAGPFLQKFEAAVAEYTGANHVVALSSSTAAIHLALQLCGVRPGDVVISPSFTFIGSVSAAHHMGAELLFLDSETTTWNLDPQELENAIEQCRSLGKTVRAVVAVHLYGVPAQIGRIAEICNAAGIDLIEDAAESLGAEFSGKHTGTFGRFGTYSFNGNKIITTSGGGVLTCSREDDAQRARKLSTQAREPFIHYEHTEVGYNYRMSNLLAAVGLGQLETLPQKIRRKKQIQEQYREHLCGDDTFAMPKIPAEMSQNYWLNCTLINKPNVDITAVVEKLQGLGIEARHVWKPMHMQPVFANCEKQSCPVVEDIFARGLCLPSGSDLTSDDVRFIAESLKQAVESL